MDVPPKLTPPRIEPPRVPQPPAEDPALRYIVPVGRSGYAIAAGYLGLFAVLFIPAPVALIFSILAIRDIRRSRLTPTPKIGMGRAVFGLVMGILFSLLLLVGVLIALFKAKH